MEVEWWLVGVVRVGCDSMIMYAYVVSKELGGCLSDESDDDDDEGIWFSC